MIPRPLSTELGEKQSFFAEGISVPMSYFICKNCNTKFLDCSLYFNNIKSTMCMWCSKFPTKNSLTKKP
jgi:hypothetical protein